MIRAIVRAKQIREMSQDERKKKMNDIRLELAKELGKINIGSPADNPGKVRALKRSVARMLTINGESSTKTAQKE